MNFVVNGTVAALVALLVQTLLKPIIELRLAPTAPNHDTVIRATALLLGVVLMAVDTLVGGPWPATGNSWLLLAGSGAVSGLAAIGGYHVLISNAPTTIPVQQAPVRVVPVAWSSAVPASVPKDPEGPLEPTTPTV